uniref:Uncharacterized protein n=1 Tax=Syphacia muris TaxID=451379 RepID=A0A0N5ATR6_9BILA
MLYFFTKDFTFYNSSNNNIEIGFVSIAKKAFAVRVRAPNEEESELLEFPEYGRQCYFLPKQPGCGHGYWYFDMYVGICICRYHMMYSQNVYLDGVGTLVFTIGDDLEARLSSQEFLHLPSACRCFRPKKSVH